LEYPVDQLRIEVKRATEEHREASSGVLKQERRGPLRRVARSKRGRTHLAVRRMDSTVYYRRIAAEELRLLNALGEGQTLEQAIQHGFKNSGAAIDEHREMLENWFAAGPSWAGCVRQRESRKRGLPSDHIFREVLSLIDPRVVEPCISLPARRAAVLGMAVHASWLGQAA
jgi:hypothetical protein